MSERFLDDVTDEIEAENERLQWEFEKYYTKQRIRKKERERERKKHVPIPRDTPFVWNIYDDIMKRNTPSLTSSDLYFLSQRVQKEKMNPYFKCLESDQLPLTSLGDDDF